MKRLLSALLALVTACCAVLMTAGVAFASAPLPTPPAEFAAQVGAMMRSAGADADPAARLIVQSDRRIDPQGAVSVLHGGEDLWVLQYADAEAAAQARSYYESLSAVSIAEQDRAALTQAPAQDEIARVSAAPAHTTVYHHLSWGPSFIKCDELTDCVQHGTAMPLTRVVAVLDSGVQSNHPFLIGRVLPSTVNTSASGAANSAEDDNGHGTQVAGVIADSSPANVQIRAYKVLDCYTAGTLLTVIAGLQCAIADGVDVINMSFGFTETSEALQTVLDQAHAQDILLVAAAGNKRSDAPEYPSSCAHVLRISAVNENGELAGFSNFGDIDLAAPGYNIKTAALGGGYSTVRATSEAAPFVAGVAATLRAVHPCLSADETTAVLKACAVPPLYVSLNPAHYGAGVLRAPDLMDPAVRALLLPYCGAADYTSYDAAVARAQGIVDLSPYEAVTVERLQAALQADTLNMTACDQPDLDLITARINAAVDGLALWSPRSFALDGPCKPITKYGGFQLRPSVRPVYARTKSVTWYSGDPDIVSVNDSGYLRYAGEGAANVYCRVVFDDDTVAVRSVNVTCQMRPADRILSFFLSILRYILFPAKSRM
ncbi:MAG: S8 family serine peptidase [Clostridia bacterium]|nr:S8 family serine peptidase [Clostridia bacterium]